MKKDNCMMTAIGVISVLSVFLFSHDGADKLPVGRFVLLLVLTAAVNGYFFIRKKSLEDRRLVLLCSCMGIFTAVLIVLAGKLKFHTEEYPELVLWEGVAVFLTVLVWCFVCLRAEGGATENVVLLVLFGGFLLRIFYVVLTQSHIYQNDLGNLAPDDYGHMGYVYYIYSKGRIPDLDPTDYYQYYQPPLYHAVSAVFLKIFGLFGFGLQESQELLQIPSAVYGTLTLFFVNKIGVRLRFPAPGRAVGLGIAAFVPFGVMAGGALNNDGLMLLLMVMALYFTLVWYENPGYKEIVLMAVCIGCSMMAKLSGALAAPAMAVLMLWKAWKERNRAGFYVRQFLCFGIISFPLGLWYSILRYVQFGMPFGFISALPTDADQFVGMHMGWERFLDFDGAFQSLSLNWGGGERADFNIPVSMVKYAVFGEGNFYKLTPVLYVAGNGLFWTTMVLGVLAVIFFVVMMFQKRNTLPEKVFVTAVVAVSMFSYVKFNLLYPFVCTMNLRYILAALYMSLMTAGAAWAEAMERAERRGTGGLRTDGIRAERRGTGGLRTDGVRAGSRGTGRIREGRLKAAGIFTAVVVGAYMAGAVTLILQLDQLIP